jgi:hypothetical protein
MNMHEIKRVEEQEEEKTRLERMFASLRPEHYAVKDLMAKKYLRLRVKMNV